MAPEGEHNELRAVLKQDAELGVPRAVAKHLAKAFLGLPVPTLDLHPDLIPLFRKLEEFAKTLDVSFRVTEGFRTFEKQSEYYDQGRTTDGKVITNAREGQSYHNYGLAFDIAVDTVPPSLSLQQTLAHLGTYWETLGGLWGGDFGDDGHFEYHPNFTWEPLLAYFTNDNV